MTRERSNTSPETREVGGQNSEKEHLNRRSYLKVAGVALGVGTLGAGNATGSSTDGYGVGGFGDGPYGDPTSLTVATDSPTNVDTSSATLNGTLSDLGDASSADVYFEWGEAGGSLGNTTGIQTLSSTGSFSVDVSNLSAGTDYEYRAVVEGDNGESTTGKIVTVSTETLLAVSTDTPTSVGETSATLNGTLADMGGASSVDVYFDYGEAGGSLANSTSVQTLSSTGSFSVDVSNLSAGTDYEYRAVGAASDGDNDVGSTVTFTTDSSDSTPTIESYTVTEAGSPNPHAEITADWSVSDADGDLDSVVVGVYDSDGKLLDSVETSVSGSSASGVNKFEIKHVGSQTFTVQLQVTDVAGNTVTDSRSVTS